MALKNRIRLSVALGFFITGSALASDVHTWHQIKTTNGSWNGRLVITSSNEQAYFTDQNGSNKGEIYDFVLTKGISPFVYGFGFENADFNVSYVLTLYQVAGGKKHAVRFSSKACQFDVSAKGPANPDIRVESYNGASCSYAIVHGMGENFKID